MKFIVAVRQWRDHACMRLTPRSQENLGVRVIRWIRWFSGQDVAAVVAPEVAQMEQWLARTLGLSPASMNDERAYFGKFVRYAKSMGWLPRDADPLAVWERRQVVVQRDYRIVSPAEEVLLERAMNESGDVYFRNTCRFAVETGLRPGTITQLRWENEREGRLSVPAAVMKMRRPLEIVLSERARAAWEGQNHHADCCQGPFTWQQVPSRLARTFKIYAQRAGLALPLPTLYDLRRTWVARMAERGASAIEVARLGGWSSIPTMFRHYFPEVSEQRQRELHQRPEEAQGYLTSQSLGDWGARWTWIREELMPSLELGPLLEQSGREGRA